MKSKLLFILMLFLSAPLCASVDEDAVKAVDLFYDLRFGQAIQAAQEMDARYPESPAGNFYLGVAYYQKYLLEDPPNDATFKLFLSANTTAIQKGGELLKTSPSIGYFYQGAAYGFQARVYVAQHNYGAAIPKARLGVSHLKKALALDPNLEDANLGLGLYYYFLSRVPAAAKPFAYMMMGMWGDRDKGLALIKEVAVNGKSARREAESVLAAIDASQKEQKWDEAYSLFTDLMTRYPHNPRYRLSLVYVLQRMGHWDKAAEICDAGGVWIEGLDPMIQVPARRLSAYRSAENLLFAGRTREAGMVLDRLESERLSGLIKEWTALRRGNYWDALGKAEKARPYYDSIQDKKARVLADVFAKNPFPIGPRDVMPNRWPLSNIPGQ